MRIPESLRRRWRHYKLSRWLRREVERRGGKQLRDMYRRHRQARILNEKKTIIQGLIRSWDLGEIRRPTRDIYEKLNWFRPGLTIKFLRDLEKEYWT